MPPIGPALARIVAIALVVGACSGGGGDREQGVPSGPFTLDLAVGECFDRPVSPDVESVDQVPCDRRHDFEVIAVVDLADGPYPGDGQIGTAGQRACGTAFADYVGSRQNRSGLVVIPDPPDEEAWESGTRAVTCVVGGPGGKKLDASVEGSE